MPTAARRRATARRAPTAHRSRSEAIHHGHDEDEQPRLTSSTPVTMAHTPMMSVRDPAVGTGEDKRNQTGRDPRTPRQRSEPKRSLMLCALDAGNDRQHPTISAYAPKSTDEKRDVQPGHGNAATPKSTAAPPATPAPTSYGQVRSRPPSRTPSVPCAVKLTHHDGIRTAKDSASVRVTRRRLFRLHHPWALVRPTLTVAPSGRIEWPADAPQKRLGPLLVLA